MYADDVLLYRNILRAEDYVSLQADLNTIDEWSSSNYTKMVCDKARKLLGLLYRKFYDASAGTLCQLYLSMVRPHLEYTSPVWSPHLAKDMELIEGVQKFALRIASKSWTMTYHDLLIKFNLPTLETRSVRPDLQFCIKLLITSVSFLITYLKIAPQVLMPRGNIS